MKMTMTFTRADTRYMLDQVRTALAQKHMDVHELAVKVNKPVRSLRLYLDHLRNTGEVRIAAYGETFCGRKRPIFALGSGPDAKPPKRQTNAQYCHRYYQRRKATQAGA